MKTLQEVKDSFAFQHGFKTWNEMNDAMDFKDNLFHELNSPEAWQELNDSVARVYAKFIAEQVLKNASENITDNFLSLPNYRQGQLEILSTPILTP